MISLNQEILVDLGLAALPTDEQSRLLKHMYETLERRVGMRLADRMSNDQLDEFAKYFAAKDDAGALAWLEAHFPDYKQIVQTEFDDLKAEVSSVSADILAAARC